MDAFIAQIMMFAGNFAPVNWAFCNGQTMAISQYAALFSLIGTTYGGNGTVNFMLPNLQCRFPLHPGTATGLGTITAGQFAGTQNVTLSQGNMPIHNHALNVNNTVGFVSDPTGALLAQPNPSTDSRQPGTATGAYVPNATGATGQAGAGAIAVAGGNQPFSIQPPYLAINFIICLNGIFPSRS
jgi:microcystin-dependent protein